MHDYDQSLSWCGFDEAGIECCTNSSATVTSAVQGGDHVTLMLFAESVETINRAPFERLAKFEERYPDACR